MPGSDLEHVLPGYYGKLPSAGDFVTRRLPLDFVQPFDRWLAQHFAPLIGTDSWDERIPLRFLCGPAAFGNAAGVICSSTDKVGRRFPLSVVALLSSADEAMVRMGGWFREVETLCFEAQTVGLTPDALDEALMALPFPELSEQGEAIDGMVVWTEASELYDIDPEKPEEVLGGLLAVSWETS